MGEWIKAYVISRLRRCWSPPVLEVSDHFVKENRVWRAMESVAMAIKSQEAYPLEHLSSKRQKTACTLACLGGWESRAVPLE